jgi:quercetin dioxygenase-like cupin family protein
MNTQAYIDSGVLEAHLLGMLSEAESREVLTLCSQHPKLVRELEIVEAQLFRYMAAHAVPPPVCLQEQIWAKLENLNKEKAMDPQDLPLINEYTNTKQWLGLVKPFIPKQLLEDRVMHVLQHTPKVLQMMVISRTGFEDETHDDLHESFIILEGECECTVGDEVFRVSAGGYASIPLYVPHSVRIISPYVLAVMQRVAV